MKKHLLTAIALAAASPAMFAQEFRGAITGVITDPTGALIAGAKVTVTEVQTATKVEVVSDTGGTYSARFLLPGDYNISARMEGFKEFVRKGVHLGAGEQPVIDIRLEVGDARQAIEITADAPLITSENASVGQAITTKEMEDLPSNGGTPMMAASLAMGVVSTGDPSTVLPFASGGAAGWSIAGSPSQTNELLVDGAPNATWDGRLAYSPPKDAVSEVRVKAFESDSAYGHSGAGTINQVLKSGTNRFRGTAYETNQPSNMVANNFFNNKAGLPTQLTHFNQYGATASGPLYLPKVYDGRNKMFWFFAFEGIKSSSPASFFTTVPTDEMRQGDFSKLLTLSSPTVLYDPYSGVSTGTSSWTRTAFPNNKIPASQLNPIALKYLQFYPKPNVTNVVHPDGTNNFGSDAPTEDGFTNEFGRLDYNISSRARTYFNVRHTDYFQNKQNYFHNISTGSYLSRSNWGGSLDQVFIVNSSNVVNIRMNFTRMFEDHANPSAGFDPTSLGFPSYIAANSQYLQLPAITFATSSYQRLNAATANKLPSQSLQLFGNWSWTKGSHAIKAGGDVRQYRLNYASVGNAAGTFAFSNNSWTRASNSASSTLAAGQDLAAFLLGLPNSGSFDVNGSSMLYSYYAAAFIGDDWRVRRNLTLNLGLRFDHDFPFHEKWGRSVNGFAFDTPSPLEAAAVAAYNKAPIPQIPVGSFKVPGGLTFASPENSAIYQNTSHLVTPRVGLAWSPERLHGKTVLRAGFGMFVTPITVSTLQISGAYSTNPILNQQGYSQTTSFTATNNSYLSPAATLSDPFPGGKITQPAGSSAGLLTFAGQNVQFIHPEMKSPYSLRWNFGIQHEITPNTMIEVVYMGNHAVHLPITYTQLNGIPQQYLSTMGTRDQDLITSLTASTPYPFKGLQTALTTTTSTSVAQLLAKYPQFPVGVNSGSTGVIDQNVNLGSSYYESVNVRFQKRISKGLSITANFMKSKLIDQTTWLNDTDPRPEKRISPFDRPTRLATAVRYELPIGKGKLINPQSLWADMLFAGWLVSGTYTYQAGGPLVWNNGSTNTPGDYVYFGGDVKFQNRKTDGSAFDTSVFATKTAEQFQYHIRTFSTTFPDIRRDGTNDFNTSIMKTFRIRENISFRLQCDAFNVVNHPTFAAPGNIQATNSAFGQILSTGNRPRMLQLGGKLYF